MKIIWDENPLCTKIELNEFESKELWYKIKIGQMEDLLFHAHFHLGNSIWEKQDLDRVAEAVDPKYYLANDKEKTKLEKRVDELHSHFIEALQETHVGDCTCVPCTCSKCWAESLIGTDTIKGLRKHEAYKIQTAFGETHEHDFKRQRNIDQAIEYLENYDPKATWKGSEDHIDRWRSEAKNACRWLKNYKKEHFNEVDYST